MKRSFISGCLIAIAVSLSKTNISQAATVTLNFDEFDIDEIIIVPGDTFSNLGIIFNGDLEIIPGDLPGDPVLPSSNPNAAAAASPSGGDITGFFIQEVDFISVFAGDAGFDVDTVSLLGFDVFDNLVASDTFTGLAAQPLSISGPGIVRFEINQIGRIGFDDLTFNTTSVPEPSTILALLTIGGITVATSKKKQS